MQQAFHDKANRLFSAITNDPRWDINDELLFQVAGFSFYGYCFGFGRLVCLMDADDIDAYVAGKLTGLGAGAKYVQGMIARTAGFCYRRRCRTRRYGRPFKPVNRHRPFLFLRR